jgi:drug/metabolite transporter (DMT)-like permease
MQSPHAAERAQQIKVHLALLFVQVTFGSWHVFGKYALRHFQPFALADLRVLGAAPIFLALAFGTGPSKPKKADLGLLALLGLLGVTANQLLFIVGLSHTTATNAGILMPSIPVFTVALGALLGAESLGARRSFGVLVAVGGAFVMLDPARFDLSSDRLIGNLMILGNCLCYALFMVLQRGIVQRMRPIAVIAWAYLFGGLGALLIAGPALFSSDFGAVPALAWWTVAYVIVVPTTINYALITWAIKHTSPAVVATYTTLQPITSAVLAAIFLGESVGVPEAIGFVLIVAGLLIVSRDSSGRRPVEIAHD